MMDYTKFEGFPRKTRDYILTETFAEYNDGQEHPHSLQTIHAQGRSLAIAARLFAKGTIMVNNVPMNSTEIADTLIASVQQNGYTYYPMTGDWKDTGVEQLVLFLKNGDTYQPYVRFRINEICRQTTPPADFAECSTNPHLLTPFRYKSLLKISDAEITNLPPTYLGITSGMDIYQMAFKGSAPNVLIL